MSEEVTPNVDRGPGNVRPYDLLVQSESVPMRMPTLDVINDRFSRALKVALFHHFRRSVQIDSGSIALVKHIEMIEGLASPSYMALVGLRPLRGTMLVVIDAPLVTTTVESRFGGSGRFPVTKSQRDFTMVEHKVMQRVTEIILEQFSSAWRHVVNVQPEILRHESNPQFAGITSPGEQVVTTTFQVKVDNGDGTLVIAIPLAMLGPIHEQLMSAVAADTAEPDGHWFEEIKSGIEQIVMLLRVELTEIEMSVNELLELTPGDVFEIERPDSVVIDAEGVALFRGRWGRFGARSAVRIDGVVKPEDTSLPANVNGRSGSHGG